jgi:hypothetical protein
MGLVPIDSDGTSGGSSCVGTGWAQMSQGVQALLEPGRLAVDQTRLIRVQSGIEDGIEKLNGDFTARTVKQGKILSFSATLKLSFRRRAHARVESAPDDEARFPAISRSR